MRIPGVDARRAAAVVRWLAARGVTRRWLNTMYRPLTWDQKRRIHVRFAGIFRDEHGPFTPGEWHVTFAGRTVYVPLDQTRAWLAWDAALALLGHEIELKETYETLVSLTPRPRLVLDVGANYGTHSILFRVHGVPTISFEPNPNCHQFMRDVCALNGVECALEPVAIGANGGTVDLWFPEHHEWFGTTDPATRDQLQAQTPLSKLSVPQITIDGYVASRGLAPDVMKIDTEGSDLQVLQGSTNTLRQHRPLIVFESWQAQRANVGDVLAAHDYRVCSLPLRPAGPQPLSAAEFRRTEDANFIAVAAVDVDNWPPKFMP